MVYKVCEFKGIARLKRSEEAEKTTIAGSKSVIRALNADGSPAFDVLCLGEEYEQLLKAPEKLKIFDRIAKKEVESANITIQGLSRDLFIDGEIPAEIKGVSLVERQ